jgi:hypothetical protein
MLLLPAGEELEAGQPAHTPGLTPDLYVFAPHMVHVPPLLPINPALQTQAVMPVLPAGELLEAGQAAQGGWADTV